MKKRILSILLAALMLLSALPLGMVDTAYAAETSGVAAQSYYVASGKCGDSATWTLDSTGTLTISGTGPMYGYSLHKNPWCDSALRNSGISTRVKNVEISSGVTTLGAYALSACDSMVSVSLPETLLAVGESCFFSSTALHNISIPNSVRSIGDCAFSGCNGLTRVTLGSSLKGIGGQAFKECSSLSSIVIPEGVTAIEYSTFEDCSNLMEITIPRTVTSIGRWAFDGCYGLSKVTFTGTRAQWNAIDVKEYNDPLLSANITFAGSGPAAPTVTAGTDSQGRPTLKWKAVSGAAKYEVYRARSLNGDYIKYSTTTGTAYTNTSYIENGNTYYYKVRALDASGTAGAWSSIVSVTYRAASTGTLPAPTVTGGNDAQGRPTLKWNAVSGAAKYEVYRARSRSGDYIKYATVTGTSYTNTSYIEDGNTYYYKVRALDANGTAGTWSSIVSVTYRKPAAATVASGKCGDSAAWKLDAEGTLTISGTGRMYDYEWPADRGGTTPPWLANKYRDSIRALHVEQGITYIGRCAFDSCGNLSDVTLPTSLRIIGQCAFNDCTALRSIQLPEGLTTIMEDAFNAAGLVSITFPSTLGELRDGAFMNCEKLQSLRLPEGLTTIGDWAFYCNPNISSIYIPASVTTIGEEAFIYYNNLATVRYGGSQSQWSAVSVAANAFPDGVRYVYNAN